MEFNKENNSRKSKIINGVIVATISIVLSAIILYCLYVVLKPVILDQGNAGSVENKTVSSTDMSKYMSRIKDALNMVSNKYVDELDMDKLVDGAVKGIAEATEDPYTRYMSEEEYQEMLNSGKEVYGGIGVHLTFDKASNSIMILGIMPDSPAIKADLKAGDLIIKVEDTTVSLDTYKECVDKMKGEKDTTVKITVKRGNDEVLEKTLTRAEINSNNVSSEILDGNIGYIKIWSFDNDIYKQFKSQYEDLKSKNITGLVIDLRNNPGGLVSDTTEIAKLLLPKCDIVRLVYREGNEKVYKCDGNNEIQIPLAVLVNSRSASAAEILSGAIKDSGKGILIGNKTYGKGIVQSIEPLDGKGALSITTAKYYTASGVEIHKNGIEPNITVDLPEDLKDNIAIPKQRDTQLQKAVEYINQNK